MNTAIIFFLLLLVIAVPYWWRLSVKRREAFRMHKRSERADLLVPATLHPRIDLLRCIGCGSCVRACPEDVLAIMNGRAAIVNGVNCVGHALCAEACPVSAIEMGFGKPKQGMEIPYYDEHFRTNIDGLYIVGELGGVGLIRNAFAQGAHAIEDMMTTSLIQHDGILDVAIVGGGPAGIAAALAARAHGLRHLVLEQDDLGGSVLHYPRQKLVLTSPVELPLYGKLNASEISKEELLVLFSSLIARFSLDVATHQKVESITRKGNFFELQTSTSQFTAQKVILALGRRGSPKKLGVPGEDLPKVLYRLIEAESYTNNHILIVGGGDSAIEAAIGLARQKGNEVTLSYRRDSFVRIKQKNEQRITEMQKSGKIRVMFNSRVSEIHPESIVVYQEGNIPVNLENDYVFIFAGGELPAEFLRRIGVQLRTEEFQSVEV